MKVFVTGANGLVGSRLVRKLAKKHKVTAFVLKGTPLNGLEKVKNVKLAFGNILEPESIEKALGDCTVVYHLAAAVHVPDVQKNKLYMLNVKGTENVLQAASKAKVKKFIYAGTIAIYGKVRNDRKVVIDEKHPVMPVLNYAKTKMMGERLVKGFCSKHKMNYIILRPSKIYGPGDFSMLPMLKLVNKGLSFTIGKGDGITMPLYVDDAADAFYLALNTKKRNREYIITGPEAMTKRSFVMTMAKVMKKKPRKLKIPAFPLVMMAHVGENLAALFHYHLPLTQKLNFFLASRRYNIEKAINELKYKPKVGIELMVRKTLDWYKEEGYI